MNIRLKEGKIAGLILVMLFILSFASCTKKDQSPVVEYQELLTKLESGEIKTIEIICIPYEVVMEIPQTIENLRDHHWYKITINFPLGVRNLEDALLEYSPKEETELENNIYRLGLLFCDKNRKEVYSMYFSVESPKVRIGDKMFMVSKDILDSIVSFIPDPSQKYFKEEIDSWFPEKNEEQAKKQ